MRHKFWKDRTPHPTSPLGPKFWLWLLAIALGTYLGLWFVTLTAQMRLDDPNPTLTLSCTITEHRTFDFRDSQFFELKCGPGEVLMLSADKDSRTARFLHDHAGTKQPVNVGR